MNDFKVDFNIADYKDIYPEVPEPRKVVNYYAKNLEECVWKKIVPKEITKQYIEQEGERFKTGLWIRIKNTILWIPPNYYFFLQYGSVGSNGEHPEFRLSFLKYVYAQARVLKNPWLIGTLAIKGRQSGVTTFASSNALFDAMSGTFINGMVGMQSVTLQDVVEANWGALIKIWENLPKWFVDVFYSNTKEEMIKEMCFPRQKTEKTNGGNFYIRKYSRGSGGGNKAKHPMDGRTDVVRCILDEISKWDYGFMGTYLVYKKFIVTGVRRRGVFEMFSSPAPTDNDSNKDVYDLWINSDPNELDENGATKTGILRHYINPVENFDGCFDVYGDCDVSLAYKNIMKQRSSLTGENLVKEIRANPLNEQEMFGSFDLQSEWDNHKGLIARKTFLQGIKFKNEQDAEPIYLVGNLEWDNRIPDRNIIHFIPHDSTDFDLEKGRWKFTSLPNGNTVHIQDLQRPPNLITSCLGIDSFKSMDAAVSNNGGSNGTGVVYKYNDLFNTNYVPQITCLYNCRPNRRVFFDDMIKTALFTGSKVQIENIDAEIIYHFIERGYEKWLLEEIGGKSRKITSKKTKTIIYGDAGKGRGAARFLQLGVDLVNAYTNVPLFKEDVYNLDYVWFEELIDCLLNFDRNNTKKSDITMALFQALIGAEKLQSKPARRSIDGFANVVNSYFSV